jgi:hypothetical protein
MYPVYPNMGIALGASGVRLKQIAAVWRSTTLDASTAPTASDALVVPAAQTASAVPTA